MMTRAQLKRFIAECVILLLVSTVLIFAGYMVSSAKSDIRVQISLVERFSPVLKASSFAPTGGAVLSDYPEINSVYIGYDIKRGGILNGLCFFAISFSFND